MHGKTVCIVVLLFLLGSGCGLQSGLLRGEPGQSSVSEADTAVITAWFEARGRGETVLPAVLFVDYEEATAEQFNAFLVHRPGIFTLESTTPMHYVDVSVGNQAFPDRQTRTVLVNTGAPAPDCVGCEGYEWIEITIDEGGVIVALAVSVAG